MGDGELSTLLEVENLEVDFPTARGQVRAVDGVSFSLNKEETLALVGETGCGKSVIAHAILRLLPANAALKGRILYKSRDLLTASEKDLAAIRGKSISLVLQNPSLALNPVYSVGHQMMEPVLIHTQKTRKEALSLVKDLLKKLRFKGPEKAVRMYPHQMSGGMKQRVLIGISVVLNPEILIADEPTEGLDRRLQEMVLEELLLAKEMNRSSLVFITHDLKAVRDTADRMVIMYAGEIVETGPVKEFFARPLHPYSRGLLDSLPERGFIPIPGTSPDRIHLPRGCRFHPRCPSRRETCRRESPEMVTSGERLVRCLLYN